MYVAKCTCTFYKEVSLKKNMTVVTVCEEQNGSAFSQEGRPNVLIVGYFMHRTIIQVATLSVTLQSSQPSRILRESHAFDSQLTLLRIQPRFSRNSARVVSYPGI